MQKTQDSLDIPAAEAQCGDWPALRVTWKMSSVERLKIGSQSKTSRPATLNRSLRRQGSFLARATLSSARIRVIKMR